jgi:hypothetical protein
MQMPKAALPLLSTTGSTASRPYASLVGSGSLPESRHPFSPPSGVIRRVRVSLPRGEGARIDPRWSSVRALSVCVEVQAGRHTGGHNIGKVVRSPVRRDGPIHPAAGPFTPMAAVPDGLSWTFQLFPKTSYRVVDVPSGGSVREGIGPLRDFGEGLRRRRRQRRSRQSDWQAARRRTSGVPPRRRL